MRRIYGLTLWRPWCWAFRHAGKDIENRGWAPPAAQLQPGDFIAIHSGKAWDDEAEEFIVRVSNMLVPPNQALAPGVITAVGRYMGVVRQSDSPWFVGPVGWKIADVVPIEYVECRGAQKLWELPPTVRAQVRINWQAAWAKRQSEVVK